ncbi:MAG TPA: hypothetical protein VFF06_31465 [Polyangia bacterium]|nr:hypothetical protein [Polyangia bacterium]
MRALVLAAALLAARTAAADSSVKRPPTIAGATIDVKDRRVVAIRGGVRAPLSTEYAEELRGVEIGGGKAHVTFEGDDCGERALDLSAAQIDARLVNAAALVLHRKKKFAEAEGGFRKALALDGEFELAATNLASAQLAQGRRDQALATLAPFFARHPLAVYARVVGDAELAPLADDPAFAPVKAATPGTARVAGLREPAVSGTRLALIHSESGWLSCASNVSLRLYDTAAGGAPILVMPLELVGEQTGGGDLEHCAIKRELRKTHAARAAAADRVLADLGFTPAADVESAPVMHGDDRSIGKARLARFGVVLSDVGRVVRGDRVLATFSTGLGAAAGSLEWLPSLSTLILSEHSKSEGCAIAAHSLEVIRIELPADR